MDGSTLHAGTGGGHACRSDVIVLDDSPEVSQSLGAGKKAPVDAPAVSPDLVCGGGKDGAAQAHVLPASPKIIKQEGADVDSKRVQIDGEHGGDGTPDFLGDGGEDTPDFLEVLMGSFEGFAQRKVPPVVHSQEGSESAPVYACALFLVLACL
jgi:hypothetical protein